MVSQPKTIGGEPVDPDNPIVVDYERKRRELDQLKASKAEMAAAIGDRIDWLLKMEAGGMLRSKEEMAREPFGIAEASAQARQAPTYPPGRDHITGNLQPEQVSWGQLGNLIEHDPEAGRALWGEIKAAARHELETGIRAADALDGPMHERQPWGRARYLAILDALNADLKPRGALEGLLIQRMASVYELGLRWQHEAVKRQELEVWQGESTMRQEHGRMTPAQQERHRLTYGYLPPRQTQAEAIAEAYLMAERFERAFLRLVREFRHQRRVFANLIVAADTVNMSGGPQQVNMNGGEAP